MGPAQEVVMTPILIIPGYQNSGPDHWQSLWEDMLPDARRVEMPSWGAG
jgi:predicted alpha/beta hydrolase family esterase